MTSLLHTTEQEIQTDERALEKSIVYDKIENSKRYDLIYKLQNEPKTLKQASDELNINYSTAKTIIQTFRKEGRISKKQKQYTTTKKALKKAHLLTRSLAKKNLSKIMENILEEEINPHSQDLMSIIKPPKRKKNDDFREEDHLPSQIGGSMISTFDISTAAIKRKALQAHLGTELNPEKKDDEDNQEGKKIKNVFSWGDLQIAQMKPGEFSHGVQDDLLDIQNEKDIFAVINEDNPEEEFKQKIDYQNPMILKYRYIELKFGKPIRNELRNESPKEKEIAAKEKEQSDLSSCHFDMNQAPEKQEGVSMSEVNLHSNEIMNELNLEFMKAQILSNFNCATSKIVQLPKIMDMNILPSFNSFLEKSAQKDPQLAPKQQLNLLKKRKSPEKGLEFHSYSRDIFQAFITHFISKSLGLRNSLAIYQRERSLPIPNALRNSMELAQKNELISTYFSAFKRKSS